MKLRKLFLAVIAGAALLTACDKKEVDLGPAKLAVNPTDVSFEAEVSSQDISLVATRDWAVTSLPDWVALSKESGAANPDGQKLSISVTENKGHNRSATIIFSIGFARQAVTINQVGPDGEVDNGDGTKEKPFTVAGAIEYVKTLGADVMSPNKVYVKGIVSTVETTFEASGTYGNATFNIVDEEGSSDVFKVYQTYYLGNVKWTKADNNPDIKEKDEVIIYGTIYNYKGNTPETVSKGASFVYSLNGVNRGGDDSGQGGEGTPKGTGTLEDPYNPAGIAAVAAALADNAVSTENYYMKGKISKIAVSKNVDQTFANSGDYGNASFYITDSEDATGEFYIYQTYYLGNRKWVTGDTDIKVGDEVIVYGPVTKYVSNYGTTLETSGKGASYIYSLNGVTDGGTVVPPTPIEHDGLTPETAFTASEANAWIMANIEGNSNTGDTKYYVKGIIQRFYQKSGVDQNFAADAKYHQASFYITDDGKEAADKEFEAYQINYLAGATFDPSKDTDVKVGDEVVIYGPLAKYNTTAETAGKGAAYLYSVNAGGEVPPTPGPGGDEVGIMETNVTMIAGTNAYDDGKLTVTYNGTTYENVKHIKYGKGSAYGNGSIVLPAGTVEIEFFAVGWKGKDATLQFTIGETVKKVNVAANDGAANTSPYSMTVADSDHYTVSLGSALAVETTVKVETIADANTGYRAFLFGVHAKKTSGGDTPGGDTPGGDTPAKPVNEGTLESPFTVADALIAAKDADLTGKEYYVKAVVGKDIAIKNGTASFELMDGTTDGKLTVVKAKSFKGAAFDGSEPLDWLDEVILKGTITEYSTLPALTEGELVKWNGKSMFKAAFTTIAQLNALATTTPTEYTGTLENAVVSFVPDAKNVIIKDATGSVLYYKNGHGLKQGQTFSGDVTVKLVLYNKASEITAIDAAFTGEEAVVEPESVSLSALAADFAKYQNAYVQVKDLEVVSVDKKNINVKNGNDTYVVYSNAGNATVEAGNIITATGTICQYSNKAQIKAWTMDAVSVQTQSTAKYVKVTSAPTDWSGTYLLVSETDNKAFNAFSGTYGTGADVTISEGVIESDATVDTYQIVIAKATVTAGAYTIKFGTKFFNWASGNSLGNVDAESVNANWNITYDTASSSVYIVNAADAARKIRWNHGSPRFACYTSVQTDVQLYKYSE